jgi:hypothetical protein
MPIQMLCKGKKHNPLCDSSKAATRRLDGMLQFYIQLQSAGAGALVPLHRALSYLKDAE